MMRKSIPAIPLVVSGLILTWTLMAGSEAIAAPHVEVPQTTHDFGKVFEDKELVHTFIIKNTGDAPLQIKDIDPDCACTAANCDRTIPPGGQGKISLTIAPFSVLKQFAKHTKVFFNDPELSQITLTMSGWGQPAIEIQPHHIVRFQGEAGEEMKAQVRFISHLNIPGEISNVTTSIPQFIEVNLRPEERGKSYVLEVKNKSQEVGHYAGKIEMKANAVKRPVLIVRVFADIRSPGAVRP
ncbi:MAG: DUF1573 domain-containing protein [Desulfobaccales bacterium]